MKKMNAEERKYNVETEGESYVSEERERGSRRVGEVLRELAEGLLFALFGYLLGACELPFGAYPFGMALLCASNKKIPYIFAGVCLSAIGADKPAVAICAYVAALIIRIIARLALDPPRISEGESAELSFSGMLNQIFSENLFLRMATSCVGAFIVSLYALIEGGFLYYDLYGAIIAIFAAPAAVFLLNGLFNPRVSSDDSFRYFSSAVLVFGVLYSARAVTLYGVSLAAFAAMFLTLYVCRKRAMIAGIAVAIICGLAYSPIYAPSFIFAAVAAGALWRVSVAFASVAAFSVGFAWGIYTQGIGAVTGLMPALLAASLLFIVLDKLFFSAAQSKAVSAEAADAIECVIGKDSLNVARLDATEQRIKKLCEGFSEMSRFFFELGDRMKVPLAGDIKQICDNAFDACCGNCKRKNLCWEENYTDTLATVASISAHVHKDGSISSENVPKSLREVCERLPDITDEINHNYTLHAKQLLLCDKTEIFALDYEAVADMLAATMSAEDSEFEYDAERTKELCEALEGESLGISSAIVYGIRKKKIRLVANSEGVFHAKKQEILETAQKVCKTAFVCESIESNAEGVGVMTLAQRQNFSVEVAEKTVMSKDEQNFCGDTVRVFENDDKFYSFISDGMGSGRDAALTSGICAMFMQKMLSSGNRPEGSLRMLNGFLRNKGGGSMHECSATIDMLELDLLEGKAAFYKSGAAPTYVFRSGSLFKLRSKTVPVGIIRELDAKRISFDVGEGDVIVMVSDGVTQGREECPWLFELLKKNIEGEGVEHTAQLIAERASLECGNDDISVVVIKVGDKSKFEK